MTAAGARGEAAPGAAVRALFADLAHAGDFAPLAPGGTAAGAIFRGEAGSRSQGTQVRVQLRLSLAARTVHEMRYRAFGCPYTLAACEWLARRLSGRPLPALSADGLGAAAGTAADWARALSVPPPRLGRLLVLEDALRQALQAAAIAAGSTEGQSP